MHLPELTRRRAIVGAAAGATLAGAAVWAARQPRRYQWLPTESAPRRFPAYLIRGALLLADGTTSYVPDQRVVSNVWGDFGSTHVVEPLVKPVPQRLDIRWFSFTEDKFYEGSFDLPWQEMQRMFDTPLVEGRVLPKPEPYDSVVVGMAPGGRVAVWMAASAETVEIATYQARVVDLPWKLVAGDAEMSREAFIQSRLTTRMKPEQYQDHLRNGVPAGLYKEYHRRYRWQPFVSGQGTAQSMRLVCFNGEGSYITAKGEAVPHATRSVPALIEFTWLPPGSTQALRAELTFDEAEVFAAFRKLSPDDSMRALTLRLEQSGQAVSVSLRDERYLLPLGKTKMELYLV